MFTFDRETAIIVAIIMCIAASIYMYKELKTTREEMESVKGMNGKISSFLTIHGLGPMNVICPNKILINWGSSSILYFLKKFP